jgi:hypothetical protein
MDELLEAGEPELAALARLRHQAVTADVGARRVAQREDQSTRDYLSRHRRFPCEPRPCQRRSALYHAEYSDWQPADLAMFDSQTDIAAVAYGPGEDPDGLLRGFAESLARAGRRAVGLIQASRRSFAPHDTLSAIALPTGAALALRHDRRPSATGCHLDARDLPRQGRSSRRRSRAAPIS